VFSSLFSRVGNLSGARILDLFAGTGAMGIEALSRGAAEAVFLDSSSQAVRIIRQNLENCHFSQQARVFQRDVADCLVLLKETGPFDVIFLDPPYGKGLTARVLNTIGEKALLKAGGLLCAETPAEESIEDDFYPLVPVKTHRYGSTRIYFFQIHAGGAESE
jgi:16S rRNA (guanine(966)-N(2))-methyltransferase RsmD